MRRNLGLVWLSFRLGALDALQYRADFAVQLAQSAVRLLFAVGGIAIVFAQTERLAGWTRDELYALMGVYLLVGGLIGLVVRPSMERMMEGVRLGTLDFTLTKPADSQLLVSVRHVDVWRLVDVGLGVAVLLYALVRLGAEVSGERAFAFGVGLLSGAAIIYSFLLTLATFAFWLIRLENILVIFASMYEAGRWPVNIYPPLLRVTLTFVVPVAFAITVPVEGLVGRLEWPVLVGTVALAVAFLAGSRWFWGRGVRRYSGASA
jgi:ABC-2 type transport system permease protein